MMRWRLGLSLLMMLGYGYAAAAADNLKVEFTYKGKKEIVTGFSEKRSQYTFNKGASKKVEMATLEWGPYIGEAICKQGWVQQLTIALLASQGYEVSVAFYPWARAVNMVETGEADILYPEYFIEEPAPSNVYKNTRRLEHLALSAQIPGGPLAFLRRKGDNIAFNGRFDSLKNEKIGVVAGYQNTPEFDALMEKGFFKVDKAVDDFTNAKKLANNRVNLIVGDPSVVFFEVQNSQLSAAEKQDLISRIEPIKPYIQYHNLHYAISKKKKNWQETLAAVNTAIVEFESSGEMTRLLAETSKTCEHSISERPSPLGPPPLP